VVGSVVCIRVVEKVDRDCHFLVAVVVAVDSSAVVVDAEDGVAACAVEVEDCTDTLLMVSASNNHLRYHFHCHHGFDPNPADLSSA
jgi:hypothetical protein